MIDGPGRIVVMRFVYPACDLEGGGLRPGEEEGCPADKSLPESVRCAASKRRPYAEVVSSSQALYLPFYSECPTFNKRSRIWSGSAHQRIGYSRKDHGRQRSAIVACKSGSTINALGVIVEVRGETGPPMASARPRLLAHHSLSTEPLFKGKSRLIKVLRRDAHRSKLP